MGAFGDAVLGQHHRERAEGVGLDDVHSDVEERAVQGLDGVGPGDGQNLVAALERGPPEVVGREVLELQVGPGRPVVDEHALGEGREVGVARAGAGKRWSDR